MKQFDKHFVMECSAVAATSYPSSLSPYTSVYFAG